MVERGADVVVVGAGAAGCVVAARLAETASRSVLLLEAGPDLRAHPLDGMHDGWGMYREHGWGFESEPDDRGAVEALHRGRLLGGTSWVTRFAMRGSPADFDEWVSLGNVGWGFDDVLPYFNRLERDLDFGRQAWHGSGGRIPVTRYPELELSRYEGALVEAFDANGFMPVDDHNRPGAVGFGRMPRNASNGVRSTTADAYLPLGGAPPNLQVRADAPVAHVVLEGDEATGVQLVDGTTITAGWVVLCAGTYGSPALLLRSGIGPAPHLTDVGVPVRVELGGVGANLADHPAPDIELGYRGERLREPLMHWLATFHSSTADVAGPPDLALWASEPFGEPATSYVDVVLLKPLSRGRVQLRSADPRDAPVIHLPGLRHESDLDRLTEAFGRGLDVATSPGLRRLCADLPTPLPTGAEAVRAAVRAGTGSVPHTVGTCAMGPSADSGGVVDTVGRVHGTTRLSVVDASVMPTAPSGFPHVITIMIAERLAETLSRLA